MKNKQRFKNIMIIIVITILIIGTGKWLWSAINIRRTMGVNSNDKSHKQVESKMGYEIIDVIKSQLKNNESLKVVASENIPYVDYLWGVYGYTYNNKAITNYMVGDKDDPKTAIEGKKKYLLDLASGKKELLLVENSEVMNISPDGRKVIYQIGYNGTVENYIYDVEKKLKKKFSKGTIIGTYSKDSSEFIFLNNNSDVVSKINIYDIKKDKISSIEYTSKEVQLLNIVSKENDDIYFIGGEQKGDSSRVGIYKINLKADKNTKSIFTFPFYKKSECRGIDDNRGYNFDIINNGSNIIFSGSINKQWGIFIFDIQSNKIYQVASTNNTNYYISPDKSKIIYVCSNRSNSEYKLNLYVASIGNNKLSNVTEIKLDKNIINAEAFWSYDSKKVLLLEYGEKDSKTMACPRSLNLVTFEK